MRTNKFASAILCGTIITAAGCGHDACSGSATCPGSTTSSTPAPTTQTFSISGNVTGATSVAVGLAGPVTASTNTDATGSYTFQSLGSGTYTVTPSKAGYTIGPASSSVAVSGANVSNVNFAATAVVVANAYVQLSPGGEFTCGRTSSGAAYCWGANSNGELGNGAAGTVLIPGPVSGGLQFTQLAASATHTCGLLSGGAAYCWGHNLSGELGDGTLIDRGTPFPVVGALSFVSLVAGTNHTCGLTAAGAAYCWGSNAAGQLGDGTLANHGRPAVVSGGIVFSSLTAAATTTCGVTPAGVAYCWGQNYSGQLGTVSAGSLIVAPSPVLGGVIFASLTAGLDHTCGLTPQGVAYCWGVNDAGQLGTGGTVNSTTPAPIAGGIVFASLTSGLQFVCGLTATGAVYCWGAGSLGQLGTGNAVGAYTAVATSGGLSFATISANSSDHICGLTLSGGAYCWGSNDSGQLGTGVTATAVSVPTLVKSP